MVAILKRSLISLSFWRRLISFSRCESIMYISHLQLQNYINQLPYGNNPTPIISQLIFIFYLQSAALSTVIKIIKMDKELPSTTDRHLEEIEDSHFSEIHFGFEVPTHFILELFQEVAGILEFDMIEREQTHATAIKQIKKTFLQMIDCFNWVSEGNMTAIKLSIQTNQKTSKRICRIRGLVGSKRQVKAFIKKFKQKSKEMIKVQNAFYPDQEEESMENLQNPFHLEACAIYMFHKILSNDQYGIGAVVKGSLNNFRNRFGNTQKAVQSQPLAMKSAMKIIQEVIDNLYKDFNYGKKEMEKVMPYCRVSVEQYIFQQLETVLIPIYYLAADESETIFREKRNKIFATRSLQQILDEIGLNPDIWFLEEGLENTETRPLQEWKPKIKYVRGSKELEKIVHAKTPREKMKVCQIAYTTVKTLFYEESGRKKELINMEEIIPVLITVILLAETQNLKGELQLVLDFIQLDPCEMEAEKRLLINLNESFNFISRDWKV